MVCLADYGYPWAELIGRLKFRDQVELATVLGQALAARAALQSQATPRWVLPMPLTDERLKQRGYNQAWCLAMATARAGGWHAHAGLLQRVTGAPAQATLGRTERLHNLRGAFTVQKSALAQLQGQRVALVDDVMTTGATAAEASRTLLRAGASAVEVWALARTPAPPMQNP